MVPDHFLVGDGLGLVHIGTFPDQLHPGIGAESVSICGGLPDLILFLDVDRQLA